MHELDVRPLIVNWNFCKLITWLVLVVCVDLPVFCPSGDVLKEFENPKIKEFRDAKRLLNEVCLFKANQF